MDPAGLEADRAGELDRGGLLGAIDLPGIGSAQPVVGALDLIAVVDALVEDAVLVAQAVPHRGDLERGERVDEARSESAKPAVAEARVRLHLAETAHVDLLALEEILDHGIEHEVRDVVRERPADEELHRQVIDALGVGAIVGHLGLEPALGEQVA